MDISLKNLPHDIQYRIRNYFENPNDRRTYDILMGFHKPSRELNDFFLREKNYQHLYQSKGFADALVDFEEGFLRSYLWLCLQNLVYPRTGKKIVFSKIELGFSHTDRLLKEISWESVRELAVEVELLHVVPWSKIERLDHLELVLDVRWPPALPAQSNLPSSTLPSSILPPTRTLTINGIVYPVTKYIFGRLCKNGLEKLVLNTHSYHKDTFLVLNKIIGKYGDKLVEIDELGGLHDEDWLRSFPRKSQLQRLNIKSELLGIVSLTSDFSNLKHLSVSKSIVIDTLLFKRALDQLPNLEDLKLVAYTEGFQKDLLAHVFQRSNLKRLELDVKALDLTDFEPQLIPNCTLEYLKISGPEVSERLPQVKFFPDCSCFVNLKILEIENVQIELSCLENLVNLKTLVASDTSYLKGTVETIRCVETIEITGATNKRPAATISRLLKNFPKLRMIKYHRLELDSKCLKLGLKEFSYSSVYWGTHYSVQIYLSSR